MQELQLYIEGQRLELFKDESVSLTQTIQNVKDVSKIFTSFTKTFALPASKNNNKIFEHYYNYDIVDGFDARIKKAGNIELNFIPYKTGRIKLEGVSLKNNLAHTYRITFFGNTVELPDILGDDKLGSLPFSSGDYTKTYNWPTIRGFLTSQQGNGKLIVPLITHTQRLFYNSASPNYDNVYYDVNQQQGVVFDQLKFAVRLYEIILEIESKYTVANGYANNIAFSRDFFNTNNPVFYNLYMWLHRKSGYVQAPQQIVNYTTGTGSWSPQGIDYIVVSGNTIVIPADIITNPNNIIDNALTVTPVSGNTTEYQVQVRESGNVIYTSTARTTSTQISLQFFVDNGVYTVTILHGAQINFSGISWFFEGFYRPAGQQAPIGWTKTVTIGSFNATTEFDFVVAEQIPDVSIMSFLTGLFKMFNLVAYVNDAGTIVVRPLEGGTGVDYSYYTSADISGADAPTNYNISKYVDVTKSQVNVALPYKEIIYRYEGTGTFLAKQFAQLDGRAWGSLPYIGGTNPNGTGGINYNASTEIYDVTVPFEHMQYERLLNGSSGAALDIQWGWSVNESAQAYIGKPLIFYAVLQTGTQMSFQTVATGTGKVPTNTYWVPSNSLHLVSSSGTQNINFALEQNEFNPTQSFTDTLFADYHSEYIIDVFNTSRRITKVTAYLPLRILYDFKLNDTFTINGRNYIINSITTNLQSGKSDMELLNKV